MTDDVADLVRRWAAAVLASHTAQAAPTPEAVATSGTVLRPPATPDEVTALEQRLGVDLPPSYRAFLLTSNGAHAAPSFGAVEDPSAGEAGLLDTDQVAWLRDHDPELIAIWDELAELGLSISEEEYADHSRPQDPVQLKTDQMAHLLQVSAVADGYATFLNPLVVAPDGEWEAWDFGTKLPGALRHRSFADLLRQSLAELETPPAPGPPPPDPTELDAAFDSLLAGELQPPQDPRLDLVRYRSDPTYRFADRVLLSREPFHLSVRQAALASLAAVPGSAALEAILAATAGQPPIQLVAVTIERLAADPDPRAHAAALRLLAQGRAASFVAHEQRDILWEAWETSGNLACIRELAQRYDLRAVEPMRAALLHRDTDPELRGDLVNKSWLGKDPSMAEAVVVAIGHGGVITLHAVRALMQLGALDEAFALITPERLADPGELPDLLEECLVEMARTGHVDAGRVVLERFRERPTAAGAKVVGQLVMPESLHLLEEAAATKRLARACVKALEGSAAPGALAALERLARPGHPAQSHAAEAIARRRHAPGR